MLRGSPALLRNSVVMRDCAFRRRTPSARTMSRARSQRCRRLRSASSVPRGSGFLRSGDRASDGDALVKGFEAPHLCCDSAVHKVSGPAVPECHAMVSRGAECFGSGPCCRTVFFPGSPVLADRYDSSGLPVDEGGVAAACVMRALGCHGADLFRFGERVEQFWQTGAVTVAA